MDRFKLFREQSARVEAKMIVVEKLLQDLQDALSECQINHQRRTGAFLPQPPSRRLPGIWRRRTGSSLN